MSVYMLMYHAKPFPDNPESLNCVGAYINCCVVAESQFNAQKIALKEINNQNWLIIELEEGYDVFEEDFIQNPNSLERYKQALIDGALYTFHTYESLED